MHRRVVAWLVLLIAGVSTNSAHAQDADTTFQSRTLRQQYFAIAYLESHPVDQLFETTKEIDAHFDALHKAWVTEVRGEHPHMMHIDPYVYAWYLFWYKCKPE